MGKVNNHINPKVYLRQFTIDKDKKKTYAIIKSDKYIIEDVGIGKICNSQNFYIYRDEDNNRITEVEDWFADFENSIMKKTIEELQSKYCVFSKNFERVFDNDSKERIVRVVLSQIVRGFKSREYNLKQGKEVYKKAIKELKRYERLHPSEKLRRNINIIERNKHLMIDEAIKKGSSLKIDEHQLLSNALNLKDCMILLNGSTVPFVTSDEPVLFLRNSIMESGLFTANIGDACVYYPISPKVMVLFNSNLYVLPNESFDGKCVWLYQRDKDFIMYLNYAQYYFAHRHVISNDKNLLQEILKVR